MWFFFNRSLNHFLTCFSLQVQSSKRYPSIVISPGSFSIFRCWLSYEWTFLPWAINRQNSQKNFTRPKRIAACSLIRDMTLIMSHTMYFIPFCSSHLPTSLQLGQNNANIDNKNQQQKSGIFCYCCLRLADFCLLLHIREIIQDIRLFWERSFFDSIPNWAWHNMERKMCLLCKRYYVSRKDY